MLASSEQKIWTGDWLKTLVASMKSFKVIG